MMLVQAIGRRRRRRLCSPLPHSRLGLPGQDFPKSPANYFSRPQSTGAARRQALCWRKFRDCHLLPPRRRRCQPRFRRARQCRQRVHFPTHSARTVRGNSPLIRGPAPRGRPQPPFLLPKSSNWLWHNRTGRAKSRSRRRRLKYASFALDKVGRQFSSGR